LRHYTEVANLPWFDAVLVDIGGALQVETA